jgi:hypothetical protein
MQPDGFILSLPSWGYLILKEKHVAPSIIGLSILPILNKKKKLLQ